MKGFLVTLAIAALLIAFLILFRGGSPTGGSGATGAETSRPERIEPPVEAGAAAPDGDAAALHPDAAASREVAEPGAETGPFLVDGTVVVTDFRGREHQDGDGRLTLIRRRGEEEAAQVEVSVAGGRFSLEVPSGTELHAAYLSIDDRLTELVEQEPLAVDGPKRFEVRATFAPGTVVHVLDATTRAELEEVEVRHSRDWSHRRYLRPPDHEQVLVLEESAPSPVMIPPSSNGAPTYWCRTPDHAWGRIEIDSLTTGERTLVLERSSSLEVHLSNLQQDSDAALRLRAPGAEAYQVLFEVKPKPDRQPVVLADVPPGAYVVSVEVGESFGEVVTLGLAEVALAPGERRSVSLLLADPPRRALLVPLSGTLLIPPGWGEPKGMLRFNLKDASGAVEGNEVWVRLDSFELGQAGDSPAVPGVKLLDAERGLFAFDAGKVAPGRFEYGVYNYGAAGEVEVGPEGRTDVAIEIPPPAELLVTVIEEQTAAPARIQHLVWSMVSPGVRQANVSATGKHGRFEFLVPAGLIELQSFGDTGYGYARKRVEAYPGRNAVTLEVPRGCGFIIEFREGEALVPVRDALAGDPESVEGGGSMSTITYDGRAPTYFMTEPGTYRVPLRAPDGYRAPDMVEVTIAPGETKVVKVQVERPR